MKAKFSYFFGGDVEVLLVFFLLLSLLGFDEISFNWMLNCRCSFRWELIIILVVGVQKLV